MNSGVPLFYETSTASTYQHISTFLSPQHITVSSYFNSRSFKELGHVHFVNNDSVHQSCSSYVIDMCILYIYISCITYHICNISVYTYILYIHIHMILVIWDTPAGKANDGLWTARRFSAAFRIKTSPPKNAKLSRVPGVSRRMKNGWMRYGKNQP